MPGTVVRLKWPVGEVRIRQEASGIWDYVKSADPNDHYRPWIEEHIGKQGWDWNWGLKGNDVADNVISLKVRKGKEADLYLAILMWS
jgi:hypothetical protein